MIVCRAASVWPPPEGMTHCQCARCEQPTLALDAIAVIWIAKFCDEEEGEHEWAKHVLCGTCAREVIPHVGQA